MTRKVLRLLAITVLAAVAGYSLWHSAHRIGEPTVEGIAAQLQCPACDGESVAQSNSPLAAAMRDTIQRQLADGRSAAQIRSWFVDRYGRQLLADPSPTGAGALLWAVPAACLVAIGWPVVRSLRRRRERAPNRGGDMPPRIEDSRRHRPSARAASRIWFGFAAVLAAMLLVVAGGAAATRPSPSEGSDRQTRLLALAQLLDDRGQYSAAADVYRSLLAGYPDDAVRLSLAVDLLRSDHPGAAQELAAQLVQRDPQWAEALLILGLAQRANRSPSAEGTLRRFLELAPQHAAATQVRRLLAEPSPR